MGFCDSDAAIRRPTSYLPVTDRVSGKGNAIGGAVRLSVRLFPLYLLNRLTFELELVYVCRP